MRSRDSGNSDEFIREVDEAVRQDRWLAIWKRYGTYVIGIAAAVVVGSAAGVGWQTYQENQRAANARNLAAATALLAEGKAAEAASAFSSLANSAGGGVGVVARLRAAEAAKAAGNPEAKVEILDGLAAGGDGPALYHRLAGLLAMQETFDASDAGMLIAELEQAATPDNPWRASLVELKAIAQMKAGRSEEARATLQALLEAPGTPASLQARARELLAALGGPPADAQQTLSQNEGGEAGKP